MVASSSVVARWASSGAPGRVVAGPPHLVLGGVVGDGAHVQREPVDDVAVPDAAQQAAQPGGELVALGGREHPGAGVGQLRRRAPAALGGVVDQADPAAVGEHRAVGEPQPGQHAGQVGFGSGPRGSGGRPGLKHRPAAQHPDLEQQQVTEPAQRGPPAHRDHDQRGQRPADPQPDQRLPVVPGGQRDQHGHGKHDAGEGLHRGHAQHPAGLLAIVQAAVGPRPSLRRRRAAHGPPAAAPPAPPAPPVDVPVAGAWAGCIAGSPGS